MGRKSYKKIYLSKEEGDVVDKIAHWTKCDESWFCLVDKEETLLTEHIFFDIIFLSKTKGS